MVFLLPLLLVAGLALAFALTPIGLALVVAGIAAGSIFALWLAA